MRRLFLAALGASVCFATPAAFATTLGLPTGTFVESWTALPIGHFTLDGPNGAFKLHESRARPVPDAEIAPLLDDAYTSAGNASEQRGIALMEMTSSWDQGKRSAFERLREAEADYAGLNDARHRRFIATLTRLIDGVGRSAAHDGSASADVDAAYAAAIARSKGDARVAAESNQEAWRTYRDAFAAFADLREPGAADSLAAELDRQRANDLAAPAR